MEIKIDILDSPSEKDQKVLNNRFAEYLKIQYPDLPPESEDKNFMVVAHDEAGEYIGAISCNYYWDGLEINTFWVKASHRGRKVGSMLLEKAEAFGAENGAGVAFLKTVDAKQFYERHGYETYGVLEDRPVGTSLYHLKKRLVKHA
ncbi:GNAT family N-acetyltransferase [Pseudomonas vancouverensis]|uniref:N-acetyltransferase n=1 Tax=Pseudomonas vancouverensis TaxID=95300 RepID=A0A1H2N420_PSEVA|nr:GNAT family N-acetyltransferase [Pseudomonas vancouverensis]KAB0495779.1 GNAT family N-acetyltransferase [Pseudomonas vancouverensis]TDB65581.1 N-acetyltransferase [Pseudomonas vancouverensis]SDU99536.1 Acetyltransferase (GNAT) domain-containing protein [Pseudomonas vancouverensis]